MGLKEMKVLEVVLPGTGLMTYLGEGFFHPSYGSGRQFLKILPTF